MTLLVGCWFKSRRNEASDFVIGTSASSGSCGGLPKLICGAVRFYLSLLSITQCLFSLFVIRLVHRGRGGQWGCLFCVDVG